MFRPIPEHKQRRNHKKTRANVMIFPRTTLILSTLAIHSSLGIVPGKVIILHEPQRISKSVEVEVVHAAACLPLLGLEMLLRRFQHDFQSLIGASFGCFFGEGEPRYQLYLASSSIATISWLDTTLQMSSKKEG